ncbi:MAG: hypothetical protein Q7T44_08310 [Parvibaculum sp.]|nr:hypothetical protein [Parvibaculum sp.]
MSNQPDLAEGRYLLYLDILGFSELVRTKGKSEVLATITEALHSFGRWEELNQCFRTIYFSDTFLFYQESKGYGSWAFCDVYAIGAFVLTRLLAKGIPARGVITYGDFDVHHDVAGRHQVYFGQAFIEAHEAEKKEGWLGISIQPSAWLPFETGSPGIIAAFEQEKVWIRRNDNVLLLNPFIKLRGWHPEDLIGEIDAPYMEWDRPDFPNEILAFKFLREQADLFAERRDFTGRVAAKYHNTNALLKKMFGPDLYAWACKISELQGERVI